ncbi:MAG TPA: hypothetical protein VIO11_04170, partial [Candidatus Methanoperedens sp.]
IQIPGWRIPPWMPNEWRAKRENGMFESEQLSLWNEEAQNYVDTYCQLVINRYKSNDIFFFLGEFQGGESTYPPTSCFFDNATLLDYHSKFGDDGSPNITDANTVQWFANKIVQHHLRRAKIFYPPYKELWDCKQELMDRWSKAYGNYSQPDILEAYKREYPDANIVLLQYTYFDGAHTALEHAWVDMLVDSFKCEVIVEAMFCGGLPQTTPAAIAKGFRGQIVQPANAVGGEDFLPWMVDNIRNSHQQWLASRGL